MKEEPMSETEYPLSPHPNDSDSSKPKNEDSEKPSPLDQSETGFTPEQWLELVEASKKLYDQMKSGFSSEELNNLPKINFEKQDDKILVNWEALDQLLELLKTVNDTAKERKIGLIMMDALSRLLDQAPGASFSDN